MLRYPNVLLHGSPRFPFANIKKQPEHVERMLGATVHKVNPTLGYWLTVGSADGNRRHVLKVACQVVSAVPLLARVRPVDRELLIRYRLPIVGEIEE